MPCFAIQYYENTPFALHCTCSTFWNISRILQNKLVYLMNTNRLHQVQCKTDIEIITPFAFVSLCHLCSNIGLRHLLSTFCIAYQSGKILVGAVQGTFKCSLME